VLIYALKSLNASFANCEQMIQMKFSWLYCLQFSDDFDHLLDVVMSITVPISTSQSPYVGE